MLTDRELDRMIRVLLAERRERRKRMRKAAPPTAPLLSDLEDFGTFYWRPHTKDHRFTLLALAQTLYGEAAESRRLRAKLAPLVVASGAVDIGKARVNRVLGEAQVDKAYAVSDWETFRARLLSSLSKEPAQ